MDLGAVVHHKREDRLGRGHFCIDALEAGDCCCADLVNRNDLCAATVVGGRQVVREGDGVVGSVGDVVVGRALDLKEAVAKHHNGVCALVVVLKYGRAAGVGHAIAGPERRANDVVLASVEDRGANVAYVLASFAAQIGERGDGDEVTCLTNAVLETSRAVELELDVAVEVAVVISEVVDDFAQRLAADLGLLKVTDDVLELGLDLVRTCVFKRGGLADACHSLAP